MTIHVPATRGTTVVSEKAIRRIVEMAVRTVPGTLDQSRVLGRDYPIVSIDSDIAPSSATTNVVSAVRVAVRAVASWPAPTAEIAVRIRSSVATWLVDMAGLENVTVDVDIDSVETGHVRVTREDLAHFSDHPQLTPVRVNQQVVTAPQVQRVPEVQSIAVPTPQPVRSISVPQPPSVRSITPPRPERVRSVPAPAPQPVRSVIAPKPLPAVTIKAPKPQPARRIVAPPPLPVARTSAPKPVQVRRTPTPRPIQLRKVTAPKPSSLVQVSVPRQPKLRPVRVPSPRTISVKAPRPVLLRPVNVPRPTRLKQVRAPRQEQLRPVSVPQPRTVVVSTPEPRPLKKIEVTPYDVD
ncbi:hypothetical protein HMPREF2708_03925 [Corynebacterium sp. HMSC073H12]|uniref:hypothetical protein n=1 Tax=Corynebacterium sp. HMSC073H12 TaxID=1715187 RepID=UPI0008A973D0|nr:hypothetical protein [Corynebacterium sp. HMSC073H12]OHQ77194.1 hypothetical protein HMPREF2708_03925 [Corynebacterium sp. HMSC073H12]